MGESVDQSHLDLKYFIDRFRYNCPFCNRRHVSYHVASDDGFDWSNGKKCYIYLVVCESCEKISMHLSFTELPTDYLNYAGFYRFGRSLDGTELDSLFF